MKSKTCRRVSPVFVVMALSLTSCIGPEAGDDAAADSASSRDSSVADRGGDSSAADARGPDAAADAGMTDAVADVPASDAGTDAQSDDAGHFADAAEAGAEQHLTAHGCTYADTEDLTQQSGVQLSWTNPHHRCVRVSAGTRVTWQGDFSFHPLVGGISPTTDETSPITQATPSGSSTAVTLQAGDYPYFCELHTGTMRGVIFVD